MKTKIRLFSRFTEASPCAIKPRGHLKEFLERQKSGLSGNFTRQGYPFNTELWNGKISKVHFTEGVYHGEDTPMASDGVWWPYEQTAYLLDGILRLSLLIDAPRLRKIYEKNLKYVISHPDGNEMLGHVYGHDSEWPMAVFAKSMIAYIEATGDKKAADAFIRHYRAFGRNANERYGRDFANIEGMMKAYEWSGDKKFLDDAVFAFSEVSKYAKENPGDTYGAVQLHRLAKRERLTLHGVTFSEMIKIPAILYAYTGDKSLLKKACRGLDKAYEDHAQIAGQLSANEFLSGRDPRQGSETCVTSDMMWSLGYFVMADGSVRYADRMEKLAFNALPGAVTKDFTGLQYISAVNQVNATPFSNNTHFNFAESAWRQYRPDHFPQCCPGNVHRVMPNYVLRMWMLRNQDSSPCAMLYGPSSFSFDASGRKVEITEETEYPFDDNIQFRFSLRKPAEFAFSFRIPEWCKKASATLNGKKLNVKCKPGTIASIPPRVWNDGDAVSLVFPAEVKLVHDRHWCWFERGPLVFSYAVPADEVRESNDRFAPRIYNPAAPWDYAVGMTQAKAAKIKLQRRKSSYPFEEPQVVFEIPVKRINGYDALAENRFTPDVPLYHHATGEERTITLQPYATTTTRVTAFPDLTKRVQLPVVAAYFDGPYPYNSNVPLEKQIFKGETLTSAEYRRLPIIQRNGNCFADIGGHCADYSEKLAYLMFRVWSDYDDPSAVFAIGAASRAQCFIDGKEVFRTEGLNEAEMTAPEWFRHKVAKGYNYVLVKVACAPRCGQYRREWGAKLEVFIEK